MMELEMKQQGERCFGYHEGVLFYQADLKVIKNVYHLQVYNAFHDEILTIEYEKIGFSLFKEKQSEIVFEMQGIQGVLVPQERTYELRWNDCSYIFVCGDFTDRMDVIMRDQNETLGYVEYQTMHVKHMMYSAYLFAIWFLMQKRRHLKMRVFMESEKFERAMKEVKSL